MTLKRKLRKATEANDQQEITRLQKRISQRNSRLLTAWRITRDVAFSVSKWLGFGLPAIGQRAIVGAAGSIGFNPDRVQYEIENLKSVNMNKDIVLGLVRHTLTSVGGIFITKGFVTGSEVETIAAAVAILVGVVWSIAHKTQAATPS